MDITEENKKLFNKYITRFDLVKNTDNPDACHGCFFNGKESCKLIDKFFTNSNGDYSDRFQLGCSTYMSNVSDFDILDYTYRFNLTKILKKL